MVASLGETRANPCKLQGVRCPKQRVDIGEPVAVPAGQLGMDRLVRLVYRSPLFGDLGLDLGQRRLD